MRFWSDDRAAELAELYKTKTAEEIAVIFGCTASAVRNQAFILGLKKEKSVIAELSRTRQSQSNEGRFRSGGRPWNKGMKGFCPPNRVLFEKGHRPHTELPIGTRKKNKDGVWIEKVTDEIGIEKNQRWRPLHVMLWEEKNGPLPSGLIVVFIDRDHDNIVIENLAAITRAENIRRNSITRYSPEMRSALHALSKLKRKISEREAENEKQD